MGKAKWWICEDCKSLNDVPANKCYNCRSRKPKAPKLIDDQYGEVGDSAKRVGVTVDLAQVQRLVAPDPKESAQSSPLDDVLSGTDADAAPAGTTVSEPGNPAPMRDPTKRSIAAIGGRPWLEDGGAAPNSAAQPPPPPPGQLPPLPRSQMPPPGQLPPAGLMPPPGWPPAPAMPGQAPPGQVPGPPRPPGPQSQMSPPPPGWRSAPQPAVVEPAPDGEAMTRYGARSADGPVEPGAQTDGSPGNSAAES